MKKSDRVKIKQLEDELETHSTDIRSLKSRRFNEKMTQMRFIGVAFDPDKYKDGENELNKALNEGFEVIRDFETGGGIVMCLGKWEKKTRENYK